MANIDVSALQAFTAAQLLTLVDYAIAHLLAGGQAYTVNNRVYTRADLDKLRMMRSDLQREVQEASSATGSLTALASFGRQQ